MSEPIEALVERPEGGGEVLVRSPVVGVFGAAPRVGEVLVGRGRVGRLTTLGRTFDLVLPKGAGGRVAENCLRQRREGVAHGQVLLRLVPVETGGAFEDPATAAQAAAYGLPEGAFAVTSPTHGVFYLRPGPDAPPYVEPGQVVEGGATLALVEVMKCFTAISYGGEHLPVRAVVVEARAEDGAEVEADQVLFVVRPADGR